MTRESTLRKIEGVAFLLPFAPMHFHAKGHEVQIQTYLDFVILTDQRRCKSQLAMRLDNYSEVRNQKSNTLTVEKRQRQSLATLALIVVFKSYLLTLF